MCEFDEKMKAHKETFRMGQEIALLSLLRSIDNEEYTTVAQIKGAIHNMLEILEDE